MARILACADVHIGRRSAGLPAELAAELTPAAAWERLVAYAIRQEVDALVVCGDLTDEANSYFESLGPLERAVRALAAARIPFVTVAGNHDWDVLGRLADSATGPITVLGRGGRWEHVDITGRAGDRVRLFGWSFPQRAVLEPPLASFPRADVVPGMASLGLLHAEVGASGGRYCPVARSALTAMPVDGWVLGHVHQPTPPAAVGGRPFVVYAGSLQGLDAGPGERGAHGVWEIEAVPGGVRARFAPLAAVQYDECEVGLAAADSAGEVQVRLAQALREYAVAARQANPFLTHAVVRLCLTGRTAVPRDLISEQLLALQQSGDLGTSVRLILDAWSVRTLPPIDSDALRNAQTPLAAAVRLWQELTGAAALGAATQAALESLRDRLGEHAARAYPALGQARPDAQTCRELLAAQTEQLIEALYAQKERADG